MVFWIQVDPNGKGFYFKPHLRFESGVRAVFIHKPLLRFFLEYATINEFFKSLCWFELKLPYFDKQANRNYSM